jgi:hypothetical protein
MIQHQPLDQPRIGIRHVLHLHQLDHVQIDRFKLLLLLSVSLLPRRYTGVEFVLFSGQELLLLPDSENGIDRSLRKRLGERLVNLRSERGVGDVNERLVVRLTARGEGDFEVVEEGGEGVFGDFETVGEDSGVDAFGGIAGGLVEEFTCAKGDSNEDQRRSRGSTGQGKGRRTDEENDRGGSVTGHLVLRDGCSCNEGGGGVLRVREKGKKSQYSPRLRISSVFVPSLGIAICFLLCSAAYSSLRSSPSRTRRLS